MGKEKRFNSCPWRTVYFTKCQALFSTISNIEAKIAATYRLPGDAHVMYTQVPLNGRFLNEFRPIWAVIRLNLKVSYHVNAPVTLIDILPTT